jgi:hypothetical protein
VFNTVVQRIRARAHMFFSTPDDGESDQAAMFAVTPGSSLTPNATPQPPAPLPTPHVPSPHATHHPPASTSTHGTQLQQQTSEPSARECYYCGKTGHLKRNCRKFKADVAAAQQQQVQEHLQASKRPIQLQEPRPAAYNVASASLQRQLKEMQQQLDRLKAEDHVQLSYGGNGKMYSTQAVLRVTVQRASRIGCGMTEIWLDGGSTHHVVRDKSLLFNRTASHVSSVVVAGGEEHSVECCGDILLETPKGQVIFHGVLCIPKFVVNLLSVPQLDLQGYSVVQGRNGQIFMMPRVKNCYQAI